MTATRSLFWCLLACCATACEPNDPAADSGIPGADAAPHVPGPDAGPPGREDAGGGQSCPPECFRAYTCASACGAQPFNNGCCPCPAGTIDTITCPRP